MLQIQNATINWTKSRFFSCTIQEISKVVCKKTLSETCAFLTSLCCMKCAHYSKRMVHKQDCIKFCGRIAWQSFFENNFADFYDAVRLKKNEDFVQPLVAFPIATSPIDYHIWMLWATLQELILWFLSKVRPWVQGINLPELASHSPFGLNLTDETALVCPARVNFNV